MQIHDDRRAPISVDEATAPMAGLTSESLSHWHISIHEEFESFPPPFKPLAIDRRSGLPYIVATPGHYRSG